MKRTIYLSVFLLAFTLSSSSQFITKPLNYPGTDYYPFLISVVNHDICWIGTLRPNYLPYSNAIHTKDGGETFEFDSIPVGGSPIILDLCAVDSLTCYYVMTDSYTDFSLWKTSDGGTSWQNKTINQFQGNYLDFYHAFSADTGVAVGDPSNAYFEIQITNDGGDTWTRVPSSHIPAMQTGEYAFPQYHCAFGNTIWFTTCNGRCFKSVDKGLNWTVSTPVPNGTYDVKFSGPDKGVFYPLMNGNILYKTTDGGNSCVADTLPFNDVLLFISPVPGLKDAFMFTAMPDNFSANVYYTPDFFNTVVTIESGMTNINGDIHFKDATTGWLGGSGNETNDIYYYDDILTSVSDAVKTPDKLSVMPNPASQDALVKLPASFDSKPLELRITDINGKEIENHIIVSSTGWTKINAASYSNGIYIIEILSGNQVVACERWIVNH
jgi:hypothetical protein